MDVAVVARPRGVHNISQATVLNPLKIWMD